MTQIIETGRVSAVAAQRTRRAVGRRRWPRSGLVPGAKWRGCGGGMSAAAPLVCVLLARALSSKTCARLPHRQVVRPVLGISFAPDQSTEQLGVKGGRRRALRPRPSCPAPACDPALVRRANSALPTNQQPATHTHTHTRAHTHTHTHSYTHTIPPNPLTPRHPRPQRPRGRPRLARRHPRHQPRRLRPPRPR